MRRAALFAAGAVSSIGVALFAGCSDFTAAPAEGDASATAPEAGVAEGGEAGGACSHDFCADFEGEPAAEWDGTNLQLGTVTAAALPDGGGAMRAQTPPRNNEEAATALVTKAFAGNGLHVEVDVNVARVALIGGANFVVAEVSAMNGSAGGAALYISSSSPTFFVFLQHGKGSAETVRGTIDFAMDRWVHVVVDVVLSATGSLRVTLDGEVGIDLPLVVTTEPPTPMKLLLGLQRYNEQTPLLSALYDNVRVDLKP